jgi:hypothetical protein
MPEGLAEADSGSSYYPILYFLGYVWIRTQRAAVASRLATN